MDDVQTLLDNNRRWAARMVADDPEFFLQLLAQQAPRYLWIGCSDSRVPANEIVGLRPGELFVHRNVANIVRQTDLNCISVLQFAIAVLRVEHVIVCGHYGCGGVRAVIDGDRLGLVDEWIRPIKDIRDRHRSAIECLSHNNERADRLCELNVLEQAREVSVTAPVQDAWKRRQPVTVHAWIYGLHDGRLHDLGCSIGADNEIESRYTHALQALG